MHTSYEEDSSNPCKDAISTPGGTRVEFVEANIEKSTWTKMPQYKVDHIVVRCATMITRAGVQARQFCYCQVLENWAIQEYFINPLFRSRKFWVRSSKLQYLVALESANSRGSDGIEQSIVIRLEF